MTKRTLVMGLVVGLSLVVGFGGLAHAQPKVAPDERFEKVAKELYPKAQQEGEVVLYSVWDVQHLVAVLNAFSKQFPGIKTNYWQGENSAIITRVMTEFQAGRAGADLIVSDNIMPVLRAAGTIAPYETVQKDALLMHDPTMPTVSLQIQTLGYNTKKMKAEEMPKAWEEITNPKYKGMVALDDPLRAGPGSTQLAALREQWKDDAKFANFIKGLKALNVPVHRSTSAMFKLVIAGEYSIAEPALFVDLVNEKEKGSPIDYARSVPPIVFPRNGAVYAKAAHPNAAKLLTEWLVSPAGQTVIDSVGREVSRKGFPSRTSIDAAWPGMKPWGVSDKDFLLDPRKWLDTHVRPIWEGK
jgi:iron(III) transport system substrate-binding protein